MNALAIEKEVVNNLRFPVEDVLQTPEDKQRRRQALRRASILGNLDRTKMRIKFRDSEGLKVVNTTIWAVTPNYVILKGARLLPLHRIVSAQ